jgi:ATP-dependent helicase/nuclease subunit A
MPHRTPEVLWRDDGEPPLWVPAKDFVEPVSRALRDAARRRRDEEHRRLFYVALTRARDRLYVCGWRGKRAARDGCWHALAARALGKIGQEVELAGGRKGLRYMRPQEKPLRVEPPDDEPPSPRPLPRWARAAAPPEPEPTRPLRPSQPEHGPPPRRPLQGAVRYRRGEIVHRLLQALPELPSERRKTAAARFVARRSFGVPEEERAPLVEEVMRVLEHPEFARVFGGGSRAEAPLAGVVRGRAIAGQVDRLLVAADEILIVDFKTRRPVPASAERSPQAYLRQMAAYRAVVAEIWPERRIACALLWTDAPRLMPLPDALLDACAP